MLREAFIMLVGLLEMQVVDHRVGSRTSITSSTRRKVNLRKVIFRMGKRQEKATSTRISRGGSRGIGSE